ncbi:MAG: choice-of-anchor J domain-containing protein [Muribaculaceae bacterium]|nr:choice-of-anchor J domain-containing protein [Muribaculaceae bacterium]
MKHFLLTGLFSAAVLGLSAAAPQSDLQTVNASENLKANHIKNVENKHAHRLAPGITLSANRGVKKIQVSDAFSKNTGTSKLTKPTRKPITKAQAPEGYVLFESFEDWDGKDINWTPEGWSVEMKGNVERGESWTPSATQPYVPAPSDGDFYYGINYSTDQQDEWLISPFVEISENMSLSYWLFLDPAFLFNMDNVDWDKYEFVGDKVVAATLQIWAQVEGGEWTMLRDYADEYKDHTLMQMLMLTPSALQKHSVNIDDYAGKKTRVAFRYVGSDGNTMFIDAIGIGYPELEGVSYIDPWETLYWGFERTPSLTGLQAGIAQYPVYSPLTWSNYSMLDDADFTWKYCDPETAEFVTSDDPWELNVTYVPDYSSPTTMRNNLFYPPTLTASAPGATPASYTAPYVYFQAGGKAERTLGDGSEFEANLLPFDFNSLGITFTTVDDPTIGDPAIPVFGYSPNTDLYWLNYTLNGETANPGDYNHLEGIANLFYAPSGAPIVINGITVYGWGQIDADAELTVNIYGLNEEMDTNYETFTKIATTKIKGSQIIAEYSDSKGYLCLPFDFTTPVALQATEEHPAYFIMFEGFRSEKVQYFVPLQSAYPDPNYLCWGYIFSHIDMSSQTGRPAYYNIKPIVYKENGDYVDPYAAFAIALEAEYPWLTTEAESIVLPADGSATTVALGSYYDGSKLTVEAPAGVEASVAGRYNECVLTVRHKDTTTEAKGNVVVKGPGVEVTLPIKDAAGIADIITDTNAEVAGMYDLSGRAVNAANAAPGVYVVKYTDGTVRKISVK